MKKYDYENILVKYQIKSQNDSLINDSIYIQSKCGSPLHDKSNKIEKVKKQAKKLFMQLKDKEKDEILDACERFFLQQKNNNKKLNLKILNKELLSKNDFFQQISSLIKYILKNSTRDLFYKIIRDILDNASKNNITLSNLNGQLNQTDFVIQKYLIQKKILRNKIDEKKITKAFKKIKKYFKDKTFKKRTLGFIFMNQYKDQFKAEFRVLFYFYLFKSEGFKHMGKNQYMKFLKASFWKDQKFVFKDFIYHIPKYESQCSFSKFKQASFEQFFETFKINIGLHDLKYLLNKQLFFIY